MLVILRLIRGGLSLAAVVVVLSSVLGVPSVRAQTYVVTEVSRGDSLNLRAEPSASAEIVGTIPHDGVGVRWVGGLEQVGRSLWREIEYAGARGWVNDRYLAPAPQQAAGAEPASPFGEDLACVGTEPFWSLDVANGEVAFGLQGDEDTPRYTLMSSLVSLNHNNVWFLEAQDDGAGGSLLAVIERTEACSDDMSDNNYSYSIRARVGADTLVSGCCNRAP